MRGVAWPQRDADAALTRQRKSRACSDADAVGACRGVQLRGRAKRTSLAHAACLSMPGRHGRAPTAATQRASLSAASLLKLSDVAPRGELGHYVASDGGKVAKRCRVRGPSFCNVAVLEKLLPGTFLADSVAIIGSTDVVIGETDR